MIRAVVFDLYETLITQFGKGKGQVTRLQIAKDLDVDAALFSKGWEELHPDRYIGKYADTNAVITRILQTMAVPFDPLLVKEIADKRDAFHLGCFEQIDDGILAMLHSLQTLGARIGLVSNCSLEEISGFRDCALPGFMDAVVLSCDVGLVKPDLRIFQLCAERLGVSPEECLFVGDGSSHELMGAANAGMTAVQAVWFTRSFVADYANTDGFLILTSPAEVAGLYSKKAIKTQN